MKIEELTIPVPWGIISGKLWGNHEDTPVLLVHGIQDNAGSFDNLIPLLPQKGFYYICVDLPGHGRSSHYQPHMLYTVMNYVENIRIIVIEHFKLEKFCYIGHSLGAHVGYVLAGIFHDRIIKFIIINLVFTDIISPKVISNRIQARINNLVSFEQRMAQKKPPEYTYEQAVERIANGRILFFSKDVGELMAKRSLCKTGNGFAFTTDQRLKLKVHYDFSFEQIKNFVDNIKCPGMVIITSDFFKLFNIPFRKYFTPLFKDNKSLKQTIVEGCHDVHIVNPERVAQIISKTLLLETNSKL